MIILLRFDLREHLFVRVGARFSVSRSNTENSPEIPHPQLKFLVGYKDSQQPLQLLMCSCFVPRVQHTCMRSRKAR